jgi:hypothetical protein
MPNSKNTNSFQCLSLFPIPCYLSKTYKNMKILHIMASSILVPSHTTINLIHNIGIRVLLPTVTRLLHNKRNRQVTACNIFRPLKNICIQSSTRMPSNMAMERPNSRIVRIELHYHVTLRPNQLNIATLGVVAIGDGDPVPVSGPFVQNLHVVPVKMHWVRGGGGVVDDDADGGVGAEVLSVPFGGVCEISFVCEEENGTVVVCAKGGAVEFPEEVACGIDRI